MFVCILPISQTNHEECYEFVTIFFHLNYPLHYNILSKMLFPKIVLFLFFYFFFTNVFFIYHSRVKLAAIVSDH